MSASALSAYGNEFSITPALDRLSASATVFENAYCNYPICAPSRFSMMTGQLPSRIDAFDNAAELPASIPTFAHYLRNAGYATTLAGKMHFVGPDQLHGFEERLTSELYPTDFVWNKVGTEFTKEQVSDARGVTHAGVTRNTVQMEHDELVAFTARRKLYDLAKRRDERPFLLLASFTHPHEPYLCRQSDWELYDDVTIPPPRVGPIAAEDMDPLSRRVAQMWSLLDDFDEQSIATARRGYFANVSYVDQLIGGLLETLRELDLDRETFVVFTSDHGDMLGERGLWFKKVFFEPSVRVPLIIQAPDVFSRDRVSERVSLVDLLPTLLSFAGQDVAQHSAEPLDGCDLTKAVNESGFGTRDVVSEVMSEGLAEPVIMLRRGRYKFIGGPAHPSQLFDLESDPLELNDLGTDASLAKLVADFESTLAERWDFDNLRSRVALTQRRRAVIQDAHYRGRPPDWDHTPPTDGDGRWLRGRGDYGDWAFDELP